MGILLFFNLYLGLVAFILDVTQGIILAGTRKSPVTKLGSTV